MATEATVVERWVADQWENRCGYTSAVLSGIVPDARHKENGGYHCSIEDLIAYGNAGDYSNQRTLDKAPPVTAAGKRYAAAVDMSMSRADMRRLYGYALAMFNNRSDPRRKYLNAINVWDGIDGHSPRRLDFQANTNSTASKDHEWHSHKDTPRAYIDVNRNEAEAWTAGRAFVSMVKGETAGQWLTSIGQGDDMSAEAEANIKKLLEWTQTVGWATTNRTDALLSGKDASYQIGAERRSERNALTVSLGGIAAQIAAMQKALSDFTGRDFTDEAAIIQGVLSVLAPERIAQLVLDGLPAQQAKQVADELARRLMADTQPGS